LKIFELKPILVAAIIGAVALAVIDLTMAGSEQSSTMGAAIAGGLTGALVQIGVRAFRVS